MCERGTVRLWSWAQYAGMARRVSFRILTIRHTCFDVGVKAKSTTLTTPEMLVAERYVPICSLVAAKDLSPIIF